jgi:hypothetical protein
LDRQSWGGVSRSIQLAVFQSVFATVSEGNTKKSAPMLDRNSDTVDRLKNIEADHAESNASHRKHKTNAFVHSRTFCLGISRSKVTEGCGPPALIAILANICTF